MSGKKLAEDIMNYFQKEQKRKYGDQPVWHLIEPRDNDMEDNVENDITTYKISTQDIYSMYKTVFMRPSNYPHMNEWAEKSMKVLNQMLDNDMCIDDIALHIAVKQGFPSIVKKVLQFPNINVNSKGYNGRTPLHECLCTMNTNMKILCILIDAGADFSAQDNNGITSLNDVILFWNKNDQEWLPLMIIDHLTDYNYAMVNNKGENLLEYAKARNSQKSVIEKIKSKI